jgi:hypothetical protein
MPYKVRNYKNKTCVYKKDTGKKMGCTKGSKKKYLAALHAAENKKKKVQESKINQNTGLNQIQTSNQTLEESFQFENLYARIFSA